MAATAFEERNNHGGASLLEGFDEVADKRTADKRMVHGTKEYALSSWGKATNGGLNRADLAAFPIVVDDDFLRRERDLRGDNFGVWAEDNAASADTRVICYVKQVLKERAALIGEESFRRTHAVRSTARKDDCREHF